ncbi:hypothetical protein [Hutsoniella sourekii]|uniref:hypothetical protein n=1 Tax=Hutsoniella sourekii TaxID=87650 RepID=UPI00048923EE|nr:hypothetical protein [Hutsoniella sourekii]
MKKRTKRTIGLALLGSAIAVAATSLYVYFDDSARERVEGMLNREKAKMFVRHRLNGSDVLVDAVDNLSDAEINTLVQLADGASDAGSQAQDTLSQLVNRAKDFGQDVADRVSDYF